MHVVILVSSGVKIVLYIYKVNHLQKVKGIVNEKKRRSIRWMIPSSQALLHASTYPLLAKPGNAVEVGDLTSRATGHL